MRATTERSEEHTSELQSHLNLVCRLLLEKNNTGKTTPSPEAGVSRSERNWRGMCRGDTYSLSRRGLALLSLFVSFGFFLVFFFKLTGPPQIYPFSPTPRSPI